MAQLATQLVNAQGLIGNSIRIPSENASAEDRAAFRQRLLDEVPGLAEVAADDPDAFRTTMRQLGAPEEATGYRLPEFEGSADLDPVPGFNEWAHEANLTQAQFETIAKRFTEQQLEAQRESAAAHNLAMEALHREWGYAFDQKSAAALETARRLGAPADFIEALEQNRVRPEWVRHYAALSEKFGEADIGGERSQPREMTPGEAQAQLDEIMGNAEHPYWTLMPGPEKDRVVAAVMKLRERASGADGRTVHAEFGAHEYEA